MDKKDTGREPYNEPITSSESLLRSKAVNTETSEIGDACSSFGCIWVTTHDRPWKAFLVKHSLVVPCASGIVR